MIQCQGKVEIGVSLVLEQKTDKYSTELEMTNRGSIHESCTMIYQGEDVAWEFTYAVHIARTAKVNILARYV